MTATNLTGCSKNCKKEGENLIYLISLRPTNPCDIIYFMKESLQLAIYASTVTMGASLVGSQVGPENFSRMCGILFGVSLPATVILLEIQNRKDKAEINKIKKS